MIRTLLLLLMLLPWSAAAEQAVVLSPAEMTPEQAEELRGALAAHLSAWQVDVLVGEGDGVAELWLSGAQFGILAPALSDQPILRDVPDSGEGWPARCEVLATVARSVLEPVLAGTLPVEEEDEGVAPVVVPGPADGDINVSPPPRGPGAHHVVGGGYTPTNQSAQGPYLHGATVGIGVGIGRHLEFGATFVIAQPADLNVPGSDVALARWPVRVYAAGIAGTDLIDLALVLGASIETWRIRDLDYETAETDIDTLQTDAAFTASFRPRLHATPWLAGYAEVGVDLYPTTTRYHYLGNTQLRRAAAQPRLSVGVMVLLGKKGRS